MENPTSPFSDLKIPGARKSEFAPRKRDERLLRWLRSCAICSSFFPPLDLLCEPCWRRLAMEANRIQRAGGLRRKGYPFPVFSLFEWTPETDSWVRPLVQSLKKARSPEGARRLAALFCSLRQGVRISGDEGGSCSKTIVPAPAPAYDHALGWSEAIGSIWGASVADLLMPLKDEGPQRLKNADDRSRRRYRLRAEIDQGLLNGQRFIFADDVITSGSTAMAAYMALGDPSHFEVWTLVCRPRLATRDALW